MLSEDFHLVTLSGPQGCGKSTTLKALQDLADERNVALLVDSFKASRSIQKDLGITDLRDVISTYEAMSAFQHAILQSRIQYEKTSFETYKQNASPARVVIMERSYADFAAYYQLWASKLDTSGAFVERTNAFVHSCREHYKCVSHHLYLPFMDHVKFEFDLQRGFESDIQEFDTLLLKELEHPSIASNMSTVTGTTPLERAESILFSIKHLL